MRSSKYGGNAQPLNSQIQPPVPNHAAGYFSYKRRPPTDGGGHRGRRRSGHSRTRAMAFTRGTDGLRR